jgi:hypothetical protein
MRGIDISSNNHHDGIVFNFADVKSAGFEYVWVKATQSNNYLNPYLIGDVRDAFHNGCKVGVYHYYDTGSPQEQAEWFIRNGIAQVAEWTELLPVLDFELSTNAAERDAFLAAMGQPTGCYTNRSIESAIGYGAAAFGWLAWPGWSNEALPSNTAVVQTGQETVPGIPTSCDVDTIVNSTVIAVDTTTPITPEEIEDLMPQYVELTNGDLVALVVTPQNHLVEVWRKGGTAGTSPTLPNFSYQDITAASNGGLTAAT